MSFLRVQQLISVQILATTAASPPPRYFKKVIAVEPSRTASKLLRLNLLINNIENVNLHEVGLSDFPGRLPFFENTTRNLGASKFLEASAEGHDKSVIQELPVTSGDLLLEPYDIPIALIKLDIEGHELKALMGLEATLKQHPPIVLFESHRPNGHDESMRIFEFLRERGYRFFYTIQRKRLPGAPRWLRGLTPFVIGPDLFLVKLQEPHNRFLSFHHRVSYTTYLEQLVASAHSRAILFGNYCSLKHLPAPIGARPRAQRHPFRIQATRQAGKAVGQTGRGAGWSSLIHSEGFLKSSMRFPC